VSRRSPLRPMLYRREAGHEAEPLAPGCFPTVSPDGRLAYAAPADDANGDLESLRTVRVVDREGTLVASYATQEPIQDVRFTGDGSRIVVVTAGGSGMRIIAFGDRRPRQLLRVNRGALSIYASPYQARVGVVRTNGNGSTEALLLDAW